MVNLEKLWKSDKALSSEPEWRIRERVEFVRLVSPLDIDGITEEGLLFTARAHIYMPDRAVAFQLEYHSARNAKLRGPIVRFDWLPTAPHNNKGRGPKEHQLQTITGSHLHSFDLNWDPSNSAMRQPNLPIAVPVSDRLETFKEALDFVEKEFRIKGLGSIPPPPWTAKLL